MHMVKLDRWRGRRDEQEMHPENMQYVDKAATSNCRGCLFDGQWSKVCMRAAKIAVRSGMKDCDDGVIYTEKEQDPRQLALVDNERG